MSAPSTTPRQFHDPDPDDEYIIIDELGCGRLLVQYITGAWAGKRSTVDPQYKRENNENEQAV